MGSVFFPKKRYVNKFWFSVCLSGFIDLKKRLDSVRKADMMNLLREGVVLNKLTTNLKNEEITKIGKKEATTRDINFSQAMRILTGYKMGNTNIIVVLCVQTTLC